MVKPVMRDYSDIDRRSVKAQLSGKGNVMVDLFHLFLKERRLLSKPVDPEFADVEFARAIESGWIERRIMIYGLLLVASLICFAATAYYLALHLPTH